MNRSVFFFSILLALAGSAAAQSELYKRYLNRDGIRASYIKDYPIGTLRTSVTMLAADSPAAFDILYQELRALPYSGNNSPRRALDTSRFEALVRSHRAGDTVRLQLDSAKAQLGLGQWQLTRLDVSPADSVASQSKNGFRMMLADPLPNDRGMYIIYSSLDSHTFLVFHAPNEAYQERLTREIILQFREAAASPGRPASSPGRN